MRTIGFTASAPYTHKADFDQRCFTEKCTRPASPESRSPKGRFGTVSDPGQKVGL